MHLLSFRNVLLISSFLTATAVLPADPPLKVACIGDSITEGAGLSNPSTESYPARLQKLLGTNYLVRNYGVSGRTLLKKGDFPYWNESAYTQSRIFAPDVVTIKLGTNDSKPQNWRHGTNFISDFEALIASYQMLPSHPRVILCTPAPVFARGTFEISPGIVATNIAPAVCALADRLGLEVIDYHMRLANHGEWFPDTVHPNTRGMAVMAAVAYDGLLRSPEPLSDAVLGASLTFPNRAILSWPSGSAGFVLQSATLLGKTNFNWTVADQIAVSDGTNIRLTNSLSASRYFRLWRP